MKHLPKTNKSPVAFDSVVALRLQLHLVPVYQVKVTLCSININHTWSYVSSSTNTEHILPQNIVNRNTYNNRCPTKTRTSATSVTINPTALTPTVVKCFERLVSHHIPTFDPHQFSYRENRWCHLHSSAYCSEPSGTLGTSIRHNNSAFNIIIPDILVDKLLALDLPHTWIKPSTEQTLKTAHSTGSPQGQSCCNHAWRVICDLLD